MWQAQLVRSFFSNDCTTTRIGKNLLFSAGACSYWWYQARLKEEPVLLRRRPIRRFNSWREDLQVRVSRTTTTGYFWKLKTNNNIQNDPQYSVKDFHAKKNKIIDSSPLCKETVVTGLTAVAYTFWLIIQNTFSIVPLETNIISKCFSQNTK